MKKIIRLTAISLGIAAILSTTTAFAANATNITTQNNPVYKDATCPTIMGIQHGFYLGGQLGYDYYRVRQNVNLGPGLLVTNPAYAATGFMGGIFAGYGQYFYDWWYLGIEAAADFTNANTTWLASDSLGSYSSKYSAFSSWNLSLLPGIRMNLTSLLYVRLGLAWDRVKTQENSNVLAVNTTKWSNGFMYGLGLESVLSGNWSVRTEYNHTTNNAFTTAMGSNFKPADNQVLIGLIYHFV